MAVGLFLLSTISVSTPTLTTAGYMVVLGLGLGMVMQVLVLAVQNSVAYQYLGVATSGSTLFRQIGGSIGVSVFGAIFSTNLASELASRVPRTVHVPTAANPAIVRHLPAAVRAPYIDAFAHALQPVFRIAAVVSVAGFLISWLLRELPLRQTAAAEGVGESFASPRQDSSERELERILSSLLQREERQRVYDALVNHSGVEITPPEGWVLNRIAERTSPHSAPELAVELHVPPQQLREPLAGLTQRGYVTTDSGEVLELTDVRARRARATHRRRPRRAVPPARRLAARGRRGHAARAPAAGRRPRRRDARLGRDPVVRGRRRAREPRIARRVLAPRSRGRGR